MTKTVYGDGAIKYLKENNSTIIARGDLDGLHYIYDYAIEHGAKPFTREKHHPLKVHKRVLDGLDRDERFKKGFITYSGIINRPCRAFRLKQKD